MSLISWFACSRNHGNPRKKTKPRESAVQTTDSPNNGFRVGSKSSLSPSKVCFPWVSWQVTGCPGRFRRDVPDPWGRSKVSAEKVHSHFQPLFCGSPNLRLAKRRSVSVAQETNLSNIFRSRRGPAHKSLPEVDFTAFFQCSRTELSGCTSAPP